MAKGRKPQPAEINDIKGNPGKRKPEVVPEDTLKVSVAAPPDYLRPSAIKIWDSIAPQMIASKLVRETDRPMMAMLVDMMCDFFEIGAVIQKDGYSQDVITYGHTETPQTVKRAHPLLKERTRLSGSIRHFCNELGFSPMARTQLMSAMARRIAENPSAGLPLSGGSNATQAVAASSSGDPMNFEPSTKH